MIILFSGYFTDAEIMFRINYSSEPKDFSFRRSALMVINEGSLATSGILERELVHGCSYFSSLSKHISLLLVISKCLLSCSISRPMGTEVLLSRWSFAFFVQVMVPGSQNNLLLKPLLSDTEYKVTVTPIYDDEEGVSVSAPGKTCESNFLPVDTS